MSEPMVTPRLLVIMGSGETSPTMSKVHRDLFDRLGPPPIPAVLLDTPFGFQENADDIVGRARTYFRQSVNRDIGVASFRSAEAIGSLAYETALARLREARWVFSGPGSPSYALRQWQGSQIPAVLADKLHHSGCVTFASAAASTLGRFALPVYEIYKVGEPPHWLDGLDLLAPLGLPAVVIPHFNNAEGGHHDTRYCYMGERRLSALEAQLPDDVFILGVDEHTACILDLGAGAVTVSGLGAVTVRRSGHSERVQAGTTVTVGHLAQMAMGGRSAAPAPQAVPPPDSAGTSLARSPLLDQIARLESSFTAGLREGDAKAAVACILELENLLVEWSRDTLESDELGRGRAALRSMIVRLGEATEAGVRDPRQVVAPFVQALLDARHQARSDRRWSDADQLRDRLLDAGVEVRDTPTGTEWDLA